MNKRDRKQPNLNSASESRAINSPATRTRSKTAEKHPVEKEITPFMPKRALKAQVKDEEDPSAHESMRLMLASLTENEKDGRSQ